MWRFWCR